MKEKLTLLLRRQLHVLLIVALIISSCSKDLGNYDYVELNEVGISEIPNYSIISGDKLTIDPILSLSKGGTANDADYTYEWIVVDNSKKPVTRRTIATTKSIDLVPSLVMGYYTVLYRVTEKANGSQWYSEFGLTITSNFGKGWLVLNQVADSARLDLLQFVDGGTAHHPVYDVLNASGSDLKLKGEPKFVTTLDTRGVSGSTRYSIYVGTSERTNWVNPKTYVWTNRQVLQNDMAATMPEGFHADWIQPSGNFNGVYIFYAGGNYYSTHLFSQTYPGVAFNRFSADQGGKFIPSPYASVLPENSPNYTVTALYDTQNRRFGLMKSSQTLVSLPTGDSPIIDLKNTGKDLVYMGYTGASTGLTTCVMKDPGTSNHYLLNIQYARNVFQPLSMIKMDNAVDLDKATLFALDPQFNYLFYAVGGKLYQFNTISGENKIIQDFGNKAISLLKYHRMPYNSGNALKSKLLVGIYDSTAPDVSGEFHLYNVANLMQSLSLYESYTGFAKIKDVSYVEK